MITLKIWRTATYKHRVTSSKKWQVNSVFIAGDAAHRTPPFLGQGLCTGIRDVANLSWKILHKEKYGLRGSILKTYESERKPHAKVVIKHAKEFGKIIGELNPKRAEKRDRTLRSELLNGKMVTTRQKFIPDITGNFLIEHHMKTKERRYGGTLFVQPKIKTQNGKGKLLDDLMPMSFLYLTDGQAAQVWMNKYEDFWSRIGGVRFLISSKTIDWNMDLKKIPTFEEIGSIFRDWYSKMSCKGVVVRPDRYVFSTIHEKNDLDLAINKLKKFYF